MSRQHAPTILSKQFPVLEERPPCCESREPIMRIENLSVSYARKLALRGVTIDIPRCCITALVGPSGCGKTSFLCTLNRLTDLIPTCKVSGTIELASESILSDRTDLVALRRRVGMIFQKPNPFPLSIGRNITFPLRQHGMRDRGKLAQSVERSLRDVGLWNEVKDRLDSPAMQLSGGQQQRLCLARAIALEPDILLLDEPCSALDPISSGIVEDLIVSLRQRFTVVVVTHNLAQARRIADDVAIFWVIEGSGQLIEHGPAHDIFESPQHELSAAYIAGIRG